MMTEMLSFSKIQGLALISLGQPWIQANPNSRIRTYLYILQSKRDFETSTRKFSVGARLKALDEGVLCDTLGFQVIEVDLNFFFFVQECTGLSNEQVCALKLLVSV